MPFDAGSIEAYLKIDTAQALKDLDDVDRRANEVANKKRTIRIGAEFDNSDVARARAAFANLDNMISRDAANRLRNSPQGSILGTLNSLFSPHPVAGAPTASQSAQQGLLGRITTGTGGAAPQPLSAPSASNAQGAPQQAAAYQQQEQQQTRLLQQIATDSRTQSSNASSTGGFLRALGAFFGGGGHSNVMASGGGGGGHFFGGVGGHLGPFFGGWMKGGGGGNTGFTTSLARGIGPGILGLGLRGAGIVGLGGAALGALPGLLGPLTTLGVGGVGLGVARAGFGAVNQTVGPLVQQSQQIQQQLMYATGTQRTQLLQQQAQIEKTVKGLSPAFQSIYSSMNGIQNRWQNIGASIAPAFAGPLRTVASTFKQLTPLIENLFRASAPLITQFVKGLGDVARTVIPQLISMFHAVAPAIRPLIDGLGQLVGGILKGMAPLIRASLPVIKQFAQILGSLGTDVGKLFADMAPAVKASMPIFRGLMNVLGALFPIIGQLASAFARALGPVFLQLANTIKGLLPILVPLGHLLADLASAILGDLATAFKAALILIKDLSPSIAILANALGSVFKVLENSGAFAILGNTLEKLAPLIAGLVNALIRGLAPAFPTIIRAVTTLSTILVTLLGAGLTTILKVLTPVIALVARMIAAMVNWLAATKLIFPILLFLIASVLSPLTIAIGAVVIAIGLLATHWQRVWTDVKNWAMDAWNFLTHGWGQVLVPGLTAVRLAVDFFSKHWQQIWGDIQSIAQGAWNWLQNNIWHPMENLFTQDIPHWFDNAVGGVRTAWNAIEGVVKAPVKWVIDNVINGLISAFDWISGKVGGPHINPVHPFGLREGGRIPGYGGGDQWPALLESGEVVVPKEKAGPLAWLWKMLGIPGYQHGGTPGHMASGVNPRTAHSGFGALGHLASKASDVTRILTAVATGNTTALANAMRDLMGHSGVGGAVGDLAQLLLDIPTKLIHDSVHWLVSQFGGMGAAPGNRGGPYGNRLSAGGPYTRPMLQALWDSAGGPGGVTSLIAAAIALAESGGRPNALNPSGASGLWQILGSVVPGNLFDPFINALNAVKKWRDAGGFSPWVTYTSGAYRAYMDSGGWLAPGTTMALNNTHRREAVLTPDQSEAFIQVGEAARLFSRGHGQIGGTGGVMRDLYLMLPEGTTVASAMNEITFRLQALQNAGYAGVAP